MIRRSSPPRRRSPLARSTTPIKKKPRKASEFQRVYGGRDRVAFVKEMLCIACGGRQRIEVAHTVTGGMGRKADARTTVPLCFWCHAELHRCGVASFQSAFNVDLRAAAVMTEAKWIAHQVKLGVSK